MNADGILLRARRACVVQAGDRVHLTGVSAAGEALVSPEWTAYPTGSYFRSSVSAADMLVRQGLAVEAAAPGYLRPLLAAVLPARSAAEAACAALAAGITPHSKGEGFSAWSPIRTPEAAERLFGPGRADPVFRLEQTAAAGRLPRYFAWRSGAVCEVPCEAPAGASE